MVSLRKFALTFALALPLLFCMHEAEARGFGGGRSFGGRSSGRSSWSSRSSKPSRSSSWSSKKSSSSKKSWGSSTSSKPAATKPSFKPASKDSAQYKSWSKQDKALASKAKASGTSYTNKKEATSAFKQKYSSQYKSKYDTKPTTRPDHIPQTYSSGGKTYNITYNQQYGGYGYMGPSGSWIMYDAMMDVAMMSLLMQRHSYYYPGVVPQPVVASQPVVIERGISTGAIVGLVFLGIVVVVVIGIGVTSAMES